WPHELPDPFFCNSEFLRVRDLASVFERIIDDVKVPKSPKPNRDPLASLIHVRCVATLPHLGGPNVSSLGRSGMNNYRIDVDNVAVRPGHSNLLHDICQKPLGVVGYVCHGGALFMPNHLISSPSPQCYWIIAEKHCAAAMFH